MKRFLIFTSFLTALVGCQSVDSNVTDPSAEAHGRETFKAIEFTIRDTSATKAPTPITSLSEFNVSATSGSAGSEASKLSNVVFTSSNGVFKSDAVWPSSDPGYHFYASNVAMTHTASGQTVKILTIDKDVVCAYLASPAYKVKNDLVFNHILARVGKVSFTNLSHCSNVRLSMKYSGSGTYNIRTGAWSGVGGQSTKELSTNDNNFWIIPGTYDATLTYTDANGNPQSKTINQEFKAGKVNNISAKLDGSVVVKTEDEYEAPTFTLGTITDVPAGGGDSGTPSVTAVGQRKRVKKTFADGTVKYDDWTAVSSPDYTIQYGKTLTSLSDNCPSYHGNNLGTTAKARTKLGDVYVRVKIGDKTTDKPLEVYQQANEETIGTLAVKSFSYSPKVTAAGGTASPTVTYELPYSWTSGASGKYSTNATLSYTTVTDNADATLNASTGVVIWAANSGNERSEKEKVTVSLKGKSNTAEAVSTQSGDSVDRYDDPVVTLTYSGTPIAYNSTSGISPALVVKQKVYYASGKTPETITLSAGDYTVSYSGTVKGLSVNSSTGVVTPSNNTGSIIAAKTEYANPSVSLSYGNIAYNGGSSSPSMSYSQTKTSYTEGRNSTNARSTKVTASVTAHSKSASATADVKQNGDGGKAQTSSETTIISGGSVSYSGYATGFTRDGGKITAKGNVGSGGGVSYGTPTVSFSAPTTTIGYTGGSVTCNEATYSQIKTTAARNSTSSRSITVTVTVKLNGKTGTQSATCTQDGDPGASKKDETIISGGSVSYSSSGTGFSNSGRTISASSNEGSVIAAKTEYNKPTVSFSYSPATLSASGDETSIPSVTYSQTGTSYSEGRNSTSSRPGSITASVTLNDKTGSKTINFTQNGDGGKVQTTSDITPVTEGGKITYNKISGSTYLTLNTTNGNVSASENTGSTTRSLTVQASVSVNNKSNTAEATVTQDAATITYRLTCTGSEITETVGESKSFSATVKKQKYVNNKPSGSASTILSGVSYVIGNSSIATLSSTKVTGVAAGTTKIYATATIDGVTYNSKDNGDSGISVTVTRKVTYSISVNPTSLTFDCNASGSGSKKTVTVTCPEGDWEVSSTPSGWTATKNGDTVEIYPNAANTGTTSEKTGTVEVRCKGDNTKTANVTVTQAKADSYVIDIE